MHQRMVIFKAGFDHKNSRLAVSAQAVGEYASCRPRSNNDEIVHKSPPASYLTPLPIYIVGAAGLADKPGPSLLLDAFAEILLDIVLSNLNCREDNFRLDFSACKDRICRLDSFRRAGRIDPGS